MMDRDFKTLGTTDLERFVDLEPFFLLLQHSTPSHQC